MHWKRGIAVPILRLSIWAYQCGAAVVFKALEHLVGSALRFPSRFTRGFYLDFEFFSTVRGGSYAGLSGLKFVLR